MKSPSLDEFIVEFYKKFREDLMPLLLKLFNEADRKAILTNSFLEANSYTDTKTRQEPTGQSP